MTKEGDVVLVYMDDNPAFFARVELINTDVKPDWFQVSLLVLQVPLLVVTWILREEYYNGQEFTMGGHPMRIEKVVAPTETEPRVEPQEEKKKPAKPELLEPRKGKKVISLSDRRKKNPE
jgi:hypothetical protein